MALDRNVARGQHPLGLHPPSRERDFPIIPVELWHVANLDVVGNNWASPAAGTARRSAIFLEGSSKETKSDCQMEQDQIHVSMVYLKQENKLNNNELEFCCKTGC